MNKKILTGFAFAFAILGFWTGFAGLFYFDGNGLLAVVIEAGKLTAGVGLFVFFFALAFWCMKSADKN